jgi:hypothetical protein
MRVIERLQWRGTFSPPQKRAKRRRSAASQASVQRVHRSFLDKQDTALLGIIDRDAAVRPCVFCGRGAPDFRTLAASHRYGRFIELLTHIARSVKRAADGA